MYDILKKLETAVIQFDLDSSSRPAGDQEDALEQFEHAQEVFIDDVLEQLRIIETPEQLEQFGAGSKFLGTGDQEGYVFHLQEWTPEWLVDAGAAKVHWKCLTPTGSGSTQQPILPIVSIIAVERSL